MQGDQVTDKNLCLAMLNQLKWDASCLTSKILECSDAQLRQDYINILNRTFEEQVQVYNFANQQGWHKPMMAEQNMVTQVQSGAQKMLNEQQQSMATQHQQAQYQAIQNQPNMLNNNQGVGYQTYAQPYYNPQQYPYNYGETQQQFFPR
ncbi:Coat F domain protein [Desulforamulus reducens MI-1]|uniref:Coat F domain protein n=1 Tax=Desulforamulus reducens (strain ATCC BAA-1160 / DSM 100696 / MI-1) TaxID=349161 RepID=A4J5V2_DESRM|nr:spore coat protein [Desulforamulus reducens]ABO50455.1 Coat F domain protein [Desulforamulus reducens MI-1]